MNLETENGDSQQSGGINMSQRKVTILGTLFRDGTQQKNMHTTLEKALEVIKLKARLGFSYIELGFAGSNDWARTLVLEAMKLDLGKTKIAAFGRTRKARERVEESPDIREILRLGVRVAVLVVKSRLMDVEKSLRCAPEQNLEAVVDSIHYLKKNGLEIIVDLEHAMDAWVGVGEYGEKMPDEDRKRNRDYFLQVISVVIEAGADIVTVCDTNGGSCPEEIADLFDLLTDMYPETDFGIHAHNDNDLAVANTRAAVLHGATHIQGVSGGYGERCGNANLFSVVPRLQVKDGIQLVSQETLQLYTEASRKIATAFNRDPSERAAWVGELAFTTFAGMHADSEKEEKNPGAYSQAHPGVVGNKAYVGVNENSGHSNVYSLAKSLDIKLSPDQVDAFVRGHKEEIEHGRFEASEPSFIVACHELLLGGPIFFDVRTCEPHSRIDKRIADEESTCAMSVFWEGRKRAGRVAEVGDGQFDAMWQALVQILSPNYPELKDVKLKSYDVHALGVDKEGTAAYVRIITRFAANGFIWTTSGVHRSSRRADLMALEDAFKWFLLQKRGLPEEALSR